MNGADLTWLIYDEMPPVQISKDSMPTEEEIMSCTGVIRHRTFTKKELYETFPVQAKEWFADEN